MNINNLNEIIENYFNYFAFAYVEAQDSNFVQAYILGKMRNKFGSNNKKEFNKAYLNYQPTDRDLKVIEHLKESLSQYFDNVKERTKQTLSKELMSTSADKIMDVISGDIEDIVITGQDSRELARRIKSKVGNIYADYSRMAQTELSSAYNMGMIGDIIDRNEGISTSDILVYCSGPLDAATCDECKKFYHEGGSFKVYRLSELMANGSNIGVKRSAWQAAIPPLHPHCRHRVYELLPGWTLDASGNQMFVSNEHHELDNNLMKRS